MNFKKLAANASKLLVAVATVMIAVPAFAEGYQVNSQSARQTGMGHTGTALKLGAESMLFNPAGMAFMDSKFDISFGITAIKSKVEMNTAPQSQNNVKSVTDNPLSTPLFGYVGYKPCKNLAVGVSITNPAGNGIKWPANWAGATFIQEISLKVFSVQPTVSYKFGDVVSLGAGLMIDFGSFSLNKALLPVGAFDAVGQLMPQLAPAISSFAGQNPANLLLDGKSKVSIGYNLGVMVNVSKKITLGASYRSKVNLSVEGGDAKVAYANDYAKTVITALSAQQQALKMFSVLDGAKFDASLPIPYILSFGAAYKPTEKWTLTADYQISGWSAYKSLDIVFDETTGGYTSSSVKNYKNSWALRIGAQWDATKFASFRIGGYVDTPPVQMDNYSPETPSATAGCFTFGATLRPAKFLSIDLALAYLSGTKTNGTINEGTSIFGGVYQKSAIMPSFGVRFQL